MENISPSLFWRRGIHFLRLINFTVRNNTSCPLYYVVDIKELDHVSARREHVQTMRDMVDERTPLRKIRTSSQLFITLNLVCHQMVDQKEILKFSAEKEETLRTVGISYRHKRY